MIKPKFILIAGPCVIEDEQTTFDIANYIHQVMTKYPQIDYYFKASYDKANRTNLKSFRGVGFTKGIYILRDVSFKYGFKILTDVHTVEQANNIKTYPFINSVQLPAFLCRQTDLAIALGNTKKTVNIKKGQFVAPKDIKHIIEKIKSTGNNDIMITERGTCFGYNNLVVDYRGMLEMKKLGYPVIFDCTHSQQKPSEGIETGGTREYIIPMALGAVTTGVDGIFVEVHSCPEKAKCDSATALHIADLEPLIKKIIAIREVI